MDSNAMSKRASLTAEFNPSQMPESVKIFLIAQNRKGELGVLTLKRRDNNKDDLAGGNVDEGETPLQAAIREIREETGYEIEDLTPVPYEGQNEMIGGKYRHVFIAHAPKQFKPRLSREHTDYEWIALKDFSFGDLHKRTAEILQKIGRRDLMRLTHETRTHELELAL